MGYLLINFCCFIGLGFLVGDQFVRHIEYTTSKNKPSYKKYMINFIIHFLLMFGFIYIIAITEGFEKKGNRALDLLPAILIASSIFLTIKILFKKKNKK